METKTKNILYVVLFSLVIAILIAMYVYYSIKNAKLTVEAVVDGETTGENAKYKPKEGAEAKTIAEATGKAYMTSNKNAGIIAGVTFAGVFIGCLVAAGMAKKLYAKSSASSLNLS